MDEVGVGSILDYAVEEDLDKPKATKMEMESCVPDDDVDYKKIERVSENDDYQKRQFLDFEVLEQGRQTGAEN